MTKRILAGITLLLFAAPLALLPVQTGAQTDDTPPGGSQSGTYCPQLSQTLTRGMRDSMTNPVGQVTELQHFLSDYYDVNPDDIMTGYFGRLTQMYVRQFQREQGLPSFGIVGVLTRAAIARVCGSQTSSPPTISYISPSIARVGDTVLVYGANYNHNTFVAIDGSSGLSVTPTLLSPTSLIFVVPNIGNGSHTVQVNERGGSFPLSNSVILTVVSGAQLSASPTSGTAPLSVNFSLVNGVDGAMYKLDFSDGSGWADLRNGGGVLSNVSHTYANSGTYVAKLRNPLLGCGPVDCDVISMVTITVTNANQPFSVSPAAGQAPLPVMATFTLGTPCTPFALVWGDGTNDNYGGPPSGTSCSQVVSIITKNHTFGTAGSYTVSFQTGSAATSTQVITVAVATGTAPTITSKDTDDTTPGSIVTIHGTGFLDRNDILIDGAVVQIVGSLDNGTTVKLLIPTSFPPSSSNHQVTVRNVNGTSNASTLRVKWPVASSPTTIILASGTSWAVPSNWNPGGNTIEVIGGGGGGGSYSGGWPNGKGGGGGGGGGYSLASNVALTAGSAVSYSVGSGGGATVAGGDTYVCNSSGNCGGITGSAVVAGAKGGAGGSSSPGSGGSASNGIGNTKRSGGTGGIPGQTSTTADTAFCSGGGGGGAAGPTSDGANGNGYLGGAGGGANAGAGGNGGTCRNGGPGSNYGGGGGGAGNGAALYGEVAGAGALGYIVITYYPYLQ